MSFVDEALSADRVLAVRSEEISEKTRKYIKEVAKENLELKDGLLKRISEIIEDLIKLLGQEEESNKKEIRELIKRLQDLRREVKSIDPYSAINPKRRGAGKMVRDSNNKLKEKWEKYRLIPIFFTY